MSWTEQRKPNKDSFYDHVILETPIGDIIIEWKSWKEQPSFDILNKGLNYWVGCQYSLEDAKKKAEEYIKNISKELTVLIKQL